MTLFWEPEMELLESMLSMFDNIITECEESEEFEEE